MPRFCMAYSVAVLRLISKPPVALSLAKMPLCAVPCTFRRRSMAFQRGINGPFTLFRQTFLGKGQTLRSLAQA